MKKTKQILIGVTEEQLQMIIDGLNMKSEFLSMSSSQEENERKRIKLELEAAECEELSDRLSEE